MSKIIKFERCDICRTILEGSFHNFHTGRVIMEAMAFLESLDGEPWLSNTPSPTEAHPILSAVGAGNTGDRRPHSNCGKRSDNGMINQANNLEFLHVACTGR
jgi:hypothetical protein